jgi:hypothetical protein
VLFLSSRREQTDARDVAACRDRRAWGGSRADRIGSDVDVDVELVRRTTEVVKILKFKLCSSA